MLSNHAILAKKRISVLKFEEDLDELKAIKLHRMPDKKFLLQPTVFIIIRISKTVLSKEILTEVEGFQMLFFQQSQVCDIAFTENCYIWSVSATYLIYIVTKLRKALKL